MCAEDHRNLRRMSEPGRRGGWGLDAVWADDLHHQLRRRTAGDVEGYYADFDGTAEDIARTLRQGWFYTGQPTRRRGRAARNNHRRHCAIALRHLPAESRSGRQSGARRSPAPRHRPGAVAGRYRRCCCSRRRRRCSSWARNGPPARPSSTSPITTTSSDGRSRRAAGMEFRHFSAFADPARARRFPIHRPKQTFRAERTALVGTRPACPRADPAVCTATAGAAENIEPSRRRRRGGYRGRPAFGRARRGNKLNDHAR